MRFKVLSGLFAHLSKSTPARNTALLNVFDLCGDNILRITTGTPLLLGAGEPTADFINQPVERCLSRTRWYAALKNLLAYAALPIQKHWAHIAGTRILDLVLAMLILGCPGSPGGLAIPGDEILGVRLLSDLYTA